MAFTYRVRAIRVFPASSAGGNNATCGPRERVTALFGPMKKFLLASVVFLHRFGGVQQRDRPSHPDLTLTALDATLLLGQVLLRNVELLIPSPEDKCFPSAGVKDSAPFSGGFPSRTARKPPSKVATGWTRTRTPTTVLPASTGPPATRGRPTKRPASGSANSGRRTRDIRCAAET